MRKKRRNGRVTTETYLSRTRSCICAVSISKVFAHGGGVCCKDQRPIMSRGICCLRSSPIGTYFGSTRVVDQACSHYGVVQRSIIVSVSYAFAEVANRISATCTNRDTAAHPV